MSQVMTATIENGLLKPDADLGLPCGTRVRVTIEMLQEVALDVQQAWQELEDLCGASSIDTGGRRLTRDQLHERR